MAAKQAASAPLTFDLKKELLDKIENYQKKSGIRSKSEVIRDAIDAYDLANFQRNQEPHRQISVRLPVTQKRELVKAARQKKVSLGELLRAAIQSLPEPTAKAAGATKPAAKKATSATKASAKKTSGAKKAGAKKAPASKAAAKAPAKKKAAAKPAARKPVAAKAPARKAAAKRAAAPKATIARRTAPKKGTRKRK